MGLGIGLAIAATALLPLSQAFTGGFRPYAPAGWLAAILGVSALLALVAMSVPTRRVLRTQPAEMIRSRSSAGVPDEPAAKTRARILNLGQGREGS
jgi:ABC-type antimicrobial peptide transport system permease subunit